MSLKSAQNRSSYLDSINFTEGFNLNKTDNNRVEVSLRVGDGLRIGSSNNLELDVFVPSIEFEGDPTLLARRYYEIQNNTDKVVYDNVIYLSSGIVYQNMTAHPINNNLVYYVEGTTLPTLPSNYTLKGTIPQNVTRYIYYDFELDDLFLSDIEISPSDRYLPCAKVTTDSSVFTLIVDKRPRMTWNNVSSPSNLPIAKIGEILEFPLNYDPGDNFLKCDGSECPSHYLRLRNLLYSINSNYNLPNIPDTTTHSYWIRARNEESTTITPESYWPTEIYHTFKYDSIGITKIYWWDTDHAVEVTDNTIIDNLYNDGFPIYTKATATNQTKPYKYEFEFPDIINFYDITTNTLSHRLSVYIENNKIIVSLLEANAGINLNENIVDNLKFELHASSSDKYTAISEYQSFTKYVTYDNLADKSVIPTDFLLYEYNVSVFKNGQLLEPSEYSLYEKSIVLSSPLVSGDTVTVITTPFLAKNYHAHLPNYDSDWVTLVSPYTFNHNLNLEKPEYATYGLFGKTSGGQIDTLDFSASNITNNGVTITINGDTSAYSEMKLIVFSNQRADRVYQYNSDLNLSIDNLNANNISTTNLYASSIVSVPNIVDLNQLTLNDNGYIGITSDTDLLQLQNGKFYIKGNLFVGKSGEGEGGEIYLQPGSSGNEWHIDNYYGDYRLHYDGTTYFTLDSDGNIILKNDKFIGIDSDSDLLQLTTSGLKINTKSLIFEQTDTGNTPAIKLNGLAGATVPIIQIYNPDNSTYQYLKITARDGSVLSIEGDTSDRVSAGTKFLTINEDGDLQIADNAHLGIINDYDLLQLKSGELITNGNLKINGSTKTAGAFYTGTTDPTNSNRLNYDGYFYATRVYNAVYSDIVDFVKFDNIDKIEYGKVYDIEGNIYNKKSKGVLGIASDTYGMGIGNSENSIPIAIGGMVLAHTDKHYKPGTPLKAKSDGQLTKANLIDIILGKVIATYLRTEVKITVFHNIKVNNRNWVWIK